MQQLWKKRYGNRGGGDKFYIDCSRYAENPDAFEIKSLLRYTSDTYIKILETLAKDTIIHDNYRHIVIKIGPSDDIPKKEYEIGEKLKNVNGFITYICLVRFYDDMKWKYVLVMPYIKEGSIESHIWTNDNISILKNLITHTVLSLATAFETVGFVHGDIHLGNILFKKTIIQEIRYDFKPFCVSNDKGCKNNNQITIPTMGYTVVIMDFEKSKLGVKNTQYFWDDLKMFLTHIDCIKNDAKRVRWDKKIFQFIDDMINEIKPIDNNLFKLIKMIEKSKLEVVELKPLTYDPNII
jgi:hypothetical protein